jgi:O-antigen/teichoic acid export membrane protein
MTDLPRTGRRPIARGTIANTVAVGLQVVFSFTLAIVLARELGPTDFGHYGVVLSVLVWIEFALMLGLPGAASILIARNPEAIRSIERRVIGSLVVIGLVGIGIVQVLASDIAAALSLPDGERLIRLASVDIPLYVVYFGFRGILQGRKRFGRVAIATIIYFAAKLLLVGGLVALGLGLEGALIGNAAASVVVVIAMFRLARHVQQSGIEIYPLRKLLVVALSIAVCATLSSFVLQADIWAAKGWIEGSAEVGLYVAAATLARMLYMAIAALLGSVMPFIAEATARGERERAGGFLSEAMRFVLVISGLAAAIVSPTAPDLLAFLFGAPYRDGGAALTILVPSQGLLGFGLLFFHSLLAGRRPREAGWVIGTVLVLQATLLALLTPSYGALGVAWALVAAGAVLSVVGGFVAARRADVLFDWTILARVVASTCATAGLLVLCAPSGFWLIPAYILGALVYAALLRVTGVLRQDDIDLVTFWK